jgi:hypothetical protein
VDEVTRRSSRDRRRTIRAQVGILEEEIDTAQLLCQNRKRRGLQLSDLDSVVGGEIDFMIKEAIMGNITILLLQSEEARIASSAK